MRVKNMFFVYERVSRDIKLVVNKTRLLQWVHVQPNPKTRIHIVGIALYTYLYKKSNVLYNKKQYSAKRGFRISEFSFGQHWCYRLDAVGFEFVIGIFMLLCSDYFP